MLAKERQLAITGKALLLTATIIWGTSFTVLKNALETLPPLFVLAIRFICSALILLTIFHKRFIKISKRTLFTGVSLGAILAVAYILQTYGLTGVTPGENAFLTSTYTVLVPFMCWLFFRQRPDIYSIIAGVVCLCGIGFISLSGGEGFTLGLGQILTLACAIFYGLQIIVISRYGNNEDPMVILCLQLAVVGIVCLIGSLSFEVGKVAISLNTNLTLAMVYMTVMCTFVAQGCQIVGQKFVPTSESALILSLESVFGLLFSLLFRSENLTVTSVIGFVLIFLAVVTSETKLKFRTKFFKKNRESFTND